MARACGRRGLGRLVGFLVLAASLSIPFTVAAQGRKSDARKSSPTGEPLQFSRDIAPILLANCVSCHNPTEKARRKNLDLSTFAGLLHGGDDGKVIVPGKPDESPLILRVRGEENPKMPPGGQNNLAPETIARLAAWIQAGARLDAGIDPTAPLETIVPSPADLRRAQLAKLEPEELQRRLEETGRARWSKASSKSPEITRGRHFLLFSTLPPDRAKAALEQLEEQVPKLIGILGRERTRVLDGPEKISVYVFTEPNGYVEFARGVESREVGPRLDDDLGHGDLTIEAPYLVALDPLRGGPEPASSAAKKAVRRKPSSGAPAGPERTLAGVLCEQLAAGVAATTADTPRWLSLGLGAFFAAQVEPRSPYLYRLRTRAAGLTQRAWRDDARGALGGQADTATIRAVGLSLLECLRANTPGFVTLVRELAAAGRGFDQIIQDRLGASPEQFLQSWGLWVMRNYPPER